MAKSKKESEDKTTAEFFYRRGDYYYNLAIEFEEQNEPQNRIDATWGVAATLFWQALTLGSGKASFFLFKCFAQGVGVEKDEGIAALMYGVALKLAPQDCIGIPAKFKLVIPESMQPKIDKLVKLVQQTQAQIPKEGVSMEVVNDQMDKFNRTVELPSGRLMHSYLVSEKEDTTYQSNNFGNHFVDNENHHVQSMGEEKEENCCCVIM